MKCKSVATNTKIWVSEKENKPKPFIDIQLSTLKKRENAIDQSIYAVAQLEILKCSTRLRR